MTTEERADILNEAILQTQESLYAAIRYYTAYTSLVELCNKLAWLLTLSDEPKLNEIGKQVMLQLCELQQ